MLYNSILLDIGECKLLWYPKYYNSILLDIGDCKLLWYPKYYNSILSTRYRCKVMVPMGFDINFLFVLKIREGVHCFIDPLRESTTVVLPY